MMKKLLGVLVAICTFQVLQAQQLLQAQQGSLYDPTENFNPQFYPYPGSDYRSASGEPGPSYWQNRADYNITATLDTAKHAVKGYVDLIYTNNSPNSLNFLWLQLDQNIYRQDSKASLTTTQSGGRWANSLFTNGYELKTVTAEADGKKYEAKFIVTDTRMQVWLENTVKAKGGKIKLTIPFEFLIPDNGTDRMGKLKTKNGYVYEIAQWFPRACVYDDIQGWNVLPYVGQGEFYLEYGDINFNITAPSNVYVVGSGELLNPQECLTASQLKKYAEAQKSETTVMIRSGDDGTNKAAQTAKANNTWKFKITNTRDAAWGASKAFIIDACKIKLPSGKACMAMSAYPMESAKSPGVDWKNSTDMVKQSIEFYSKTYYEYPYACAVNVAGIVGGMEYPGIVFCGYQAKGASLWGVTDHEFGHTWFPMIVGSNERKYAWMDEGFNTFINDFSTMNYDNGKYKSNSELAKVDFSGIGGMLGAKGTNLFNAPDIIRQMELGEAAYYKPSIMLHQLRFNVLGEERFGLAFKEYIKRWAFKHPTPWDFFRTMENVGGEDLSWFWRAWVINPWKLDIAVINVKGNKVVFENMEKMAMPFTVKIKTKSGEERKITFPIEVWQRSSAYNFSLPEGEEIEEVTVDPDNMLPDSNRKNNSWKKAI